MPRHRTPRPSSLKDARQAVLLDYLRLRAERPENRSAAERQARRGLKAMALAPTLEVCQALLRDEQAHWTLLDASQAARHGIRAGARNQDGRYGLDDFHDLPVR